MRLREKAERAATRAGLTNEQERAVYIGAYVTSYRMWSARFARKEIEMGKPTKTGKGVDALFEQEQREKKAKAKREKRAAAKIADALDRQVASPQAREVKRSSSTTTSGGAFDPDPPPNAGNSLRRSDLDEPAPVRLTLAALAKAFDDACTHTETAQAVLEDAVRQQAKAKEALDQACSRRANGERA